MWEVENNGFLPKQRPEYVLRNDSNSTGRKLDDLGQLLPELLMDRKVREELVADLRGLQKHMPGYLDMLKDDPAQLERVMMLFSYFASAYIFAFGEKPADRLPEEIAVPFAAVSSLVGRPPILSYASYCLNNWMHTDHEKPVELGAIKLLQKFVHPKFDGCVDEDWFILVHVDIEARAAEAMSAINESHAHIESDNGSKVSECIHRLLKSLLAMNVTLKRMTEHCRPEFYFKVVRPYIFSFENVTYEGVYDKPKTFRGETGAQSSIVPAVQTALGVLHKDSMLTKHLSDMRNYMPPQHRKYLVDLSEKPTLRSYVQKDDSLKSLYNSCVEELSEFRSTHLQYAVDYIQKKVDNPKGTGGTPFIPWLSQLQKETEEYLL